jgi:arsenate reductase (thioredoxin)
MDKPLILILCTGNSCRSQMAEATPRREVGDIVRVESAGSNPAKHVHPKAVQVMDEIGIDIQQNVRRCTHLGSEVVAMLLSRSA